MIYQRLKITFTKAPTCTCRWADKIVFSRFNDTQNPKRTKQSS